MSLFQSIFRRLNLYSTSVSIKPLTRLLKTCHTLEYLNLASCRGLPRGIKRLYNNRDLIVQLRNDIADGKFKDCDNDDDDDQTTPEMTKPIHFCQQHDGLLNLSSLSTPIQSQEEGLKLERKQPQYCNFTLFTTDIFQ